MTQKIMTVDDSTSMRQMVRATLQSAGYGVVEAADGQDALDYARENAVDLVISDVNMPRMDGITLVGELRALPAYRLTPLLLLTTESSQEKKMEGKTRRRHGLDRQALQPGAVAGHAGRTVRHRHERIAFHCRRCSSSPRRQLEVAAADANSHVATLATSVAAISTLGAELRSHAGPGGGGAGRATAGRGAARHVRDAVPRSAGATRRTRARRARRHARCAGRAGAGADCACCSP